MSEGVEHVSTSPAFAEYVPPRRVSNEQFAALFAAWFLEQHVSGLPMAVSEILQESERFARETHVSHPKQNNFLCALRKVHGVEKHSDENVRLHFSDHKITLQTTVYRIWASESLEPVNSVKPTDMLSPEIGRFIQ